MIAGADSANVAGFFGKMNVEMIIIPTVVVNLYRQTGKNDEGGGARRPAFRGLVFGAIFLLYHNPGIIRPVDW